MATRGWGGSIALAIGVGAGAAAAQLGVAYGLGIMTWPAATDPAGDRAWLASLAWTAWVAATATVLGAIVADRLSPGQPGAAPPRLMHLMDREGDVYEVLQWVEEIGDSAIIRCVQNRRVDDPLRFGHAAVRAQPVLGCVTLTVPRSHGKPARPATVEMRALTTRLCPDRKNALIGIRGLLKRVAQ